jgi:starch-binding outer membrane protein, SusD/RagB family
MKNIVLLLFTLFFFTTGCKKMLEESPNDRLFSAGFYKTETDANSAINAIYAPLRQNYSARYSYQFTAMEDYATAQGAYLPYAQYVMNSSTIAKTDNIFQVFYEVINFANTALKYIPSISAMDSTKNKALLAEAHFLRALSYRNLVLSWGGVPIRSEPTESTETLGGKRASVAEVYNFIISDLQYAETYLPSTQSLAGKPTRWAAKTMLADVYLTNERWTEARDEADEVINSGAYSLVSVTQASDFEKIFGPTAITSSEDVFSLKYSRTSGSPMALYYAMPNSAYASAGFGTFYGLPTYPILRDWDKKDLRYQFNIYTSYPDKSGAIVQNSASQPIRFGKFKDPGYAPEHGNDYPLYRYPDALFIYAEAASQAAGGPTILALERLNMVRRRAYGYNSKVPSPIDFTIATAPTGTSFRDLVLRERTYEFMCENKRWFDLIRTKTAKQVIKTAKGIDIPDYFLLFPIPQQEIDNNPDIGPEDQNPGY